MLPKKLQIEQINRFHKTMKKLKEKIDAESDKEKKSDLCRKFFQLDKLHQKIDDFIEFTLKQELDSMHLD